MREIIAICRSSKASRVRVAAVLDRYFWRIGDRTWRGRASNACLDRVSRELRAGAKRNTAVAIHEIRSARESRVPIVRIGSRLAFSPDGLAPVSTHAAKAFRQASRDTNERGLLSVVLIAALFHDLGKATRLFQEKLRRSLKKNAQPEADPIRHELVSAIVWDVLVGALNDADLIEKIRGLNTDQIDAAWAKASLRTREIYRNADKPLPLAFAEREGGIAHAVGMLILTHHRLPEGAANHCRLLARHHVRSDAPLGACDLEIAQGDPFWRDANWTSRLNRTADDLRPGMAFPGLDIALRAALMFADHLGSARKQAREAHKGHLGNTDRATRRPADPLDMHIRRVLQCVPGCFDMLHRHRERYPALGEDATPLDLVHAPPASGPYAWQSTAARAARALCEQKEGGFFACLMAGTGTGKTRAAPTVLAAAAFGDARPERRYLRMTLALGLRSLASQSAQDYVRDLGFAPDDVAVLIGQPPLRFPEADDAPTLDDGSQSIVALPSWLRVERATGGVPNEGDAREADWLRRLSWDTERRLPATLDRYLEEAGKNNPSAHLLASAPIVVGTVDHLMGVASPTRAGFLLQAVRVLSADLILDEIDQYEGEDIAAIARLVYQTAAGGRRVIIMSATLPEDVASALYAAYREGWRIHAAAMGLADHVNVLCSGGGADACITNADGSAFDDVYEACRAQTVARLDASSPQRRGIVLPPCGSWAELLAQVDRQATEFHDLASTNIDGIRVSIGFVRMTRIAHTAALAAQLPAGPREGRLRLKLCLHSQFPRLHREWIERELKAALTRKGRDPDAGLRDFCSRHGLAERAQRHGCRHIEIVVVTSPVIETGNDLDFDWAILDPSSMRAVVQAAGRVWRHRIYKGDRPNVAILGKSVIVMQTGKLSRPGVETPPHRDTRVPWVSLEEFGGRTVPELVGIGTFDRIDASAVLKREAIGLRDKEALLRGKMVSVADGVEPAPLGLYLCSSTVRLNRRITESRRFRRSTTRDIEYFQDGETTEEAAWFVDLAPGTRDSSPRLAVNCGLDLVDTEEEKSHLLFPGLGERALAAYSRSPDAIDASTRRRLMRVSVPDYGDEIEPAMSYREWTGFTRGSREDIFQPFGKNQ